MNEKFEVEIRGTRPLLMHSVESMTAGEELTKKDRGTKVEAEMYLYKMKKEKYVVLLS